MYIYFDSNGVLREIINDKAVRQGDLNANEVLVYIENVEPADIWITFRKPGGAFSTEKSFITNKITKEIPYNKNRDMRYFKDLTEYTFYKFVISDEITEAGTYEATIRFTYADSLVALGKFVFNAEPSVIKQDNLITQAQYNYLIWYVGSWQGQIGNLASGIATLNSEITTIKSRLDTNEANITNLLSNYVKKTSLTTNSSQSIKPVVNGDFITFEIRNLQSSDNLIKLDNENGIYVSANGVISLVSARIVSDSNLRNAIKGVVYEVGTTKDWQSGTQVNSKITTHDENTTAHAYLRGLINDISQEIARIDARGRSYGEIDKTLSELLLESDKDLYIYNYLTNKYSGYENQVGNLIYTKVSDNEPEHEFEYNGTNWVDNGAYLISKADNTQFGMVKGDNEYISILNGLIQVLKSDYATRLGTSGANYTYSDLLNTLTQFATDLANRYTKAETLFELEQRITDLLSASVLQDTRITYNGQDTFTYTNQTPVVFPHSVFSEFSWAIMRVEESGIVEYTSLKPAQAVNGIKLELAMFSKDEYASFQLLNGNWQFSVYTKNGNLANTTATLRIWGVKLGNINANEVDYTSDKTVKDALDDILGNELYITASHLSLESEITATKEIEIKDQTGEVVKIVGTNPSDLINDFDAMKEMNIKNDNGIPFTELSDAEIQQQIDLWVEQGFPSKVEKLISKNDNLFNGQFNILSSLECEYINDNSSLLIDADNNNVPDGFGNNCGGTKTLVNGVWTLTATAAWQGLDFNPKPSCKIGDIIYSYVILKTDSNKLRFAMSNPNINIYHSGNNEYEYLSLIHTKENNLVQVSVNDTRASDWTAFSIKGMGAINITDLVNRGILPNGLSNQEYKDILDNANFNNVPLRESVYIQVEPNTIYKLIKTSSNDNIIHKLLEYTNNDKLVKVNDITYTSNKSQAITTNALTHKVKLVSDLVDRVLTLNPNNNFDDETMQIGYGNYWTNYRCSAAIANDKLTLTGNADGSYLTCYHDFTPDLPTDDFLYLQWKARTTSDNITKIACQGSGFVIVDYTLSVNNPIKDNWYVRSGISVSRSGLQRFDMRLEATNVNGKVLEVDFMNIYNVSDFIRKGVKDDNGVLFSMLTNNEIKEQLDTWMITGFPDHVIAALYPNGVDSAIALKYNDADDEFRPQQFDELPLNLTLRSGEYWQDGYVVKQNGNAEYYPLDTKFSAWNYGQLEVHYKSGFPMDFYIKYAQNVAAQTKTTQEYLVEARGQIDNLMTGYTRIVDKLGDTIFENNFDSFAGITNALYEYYQLDGIRENNKLAIEGYGQSIENLLGKGTTIQASQTMRGLTITYDNATGIFTINGTATAGSAFNITLVNNMNLDLPTGTPIQLLRYYDSADGGTVDLNGSYIGYVLQGASVSNRINENSESLYDPYINSSGNLTANTSEYKQRILFQVWKAGITFNNFKFKLGIYQGLQLRPYTMPNVLANSKVQVYNKTANKFHLENALNITDSQNPQLTITYNPLLQEFLINGYVNSSKNISLQFTLPIKSGEKVSIKRLYLSGDVSPTSSGILPQLRLIDTASSVVLYNEIYKMTAPDGETPTPDVSFNTATATSDTTLTLNLGITYGQEFFNYRFRLMIHDKSTDFGYVKYQRDLIGSFNLGANEKGTLTFNALPFGILEFIADSSSLNLLFGDSLSDLRYSNLQYNAGIVSPNRKISELSERITTLDNPFRNKIIAIWGDSRESNNPTSDPTGVGDQKDTSWPALLAKKLGATVLNYGLSGGAWAENTIQQDAAAAIVNRVLTEDPNASADVIIISSMNDFKLATPLGSPLPNNKDKTTYYGAMRLTYDRLATKYPHKMIWLVIPQKRYDENTDYGGGIYHQYLKAQVDVAQEYGIPTIDLYNNFPNSKPTFYNTYMLNDTHFNEYGNDYVAELIARSMIGGGNSAFGFSFDLMKTSPDGNVWKLDWSIDNNGNITWSPVKLTT